MQGTPDVTNAENSTPAGELPAPGTQTPSKSLPTAAETPAPGAEPGIEERLKKALFAAAERPEAWLRAKAETENVRKRAQTEIAGAHKFAVENFATQLLAVRDSLEAAIAAETPSTDSMKSGVEVTLKQLVSVFERF